jgi:hypothetical protein
MSAIDHRAEAEAAASAGKYDIAQYHAAMLQADRQHTANLIAYVALIDAQFAEAEKNPGPWDMSSYAAGNARRERAQELIREGLGL